VDLAARSIGSGCRSDDFDRLAVISRFMVAVSFAIPLPWIEGQSLLGGILQNPPPSSSLQLSNECRICCAGTLGYCSCGTSDRTYSPVASLEEIDTTFSNSMWPAQLIQHILSVNSVP
jgi:hypothetical protein